jgi:hypothetical protein
MKDQPIKRKIAMLQEIIKEFETRVGEGARIPASHVRRWMGSDDPDTLGATYGFLSNATHAQRISPPLSLDEVFDFMLRYYEFCLKTDPKSKWANSRYSAGWDLVGWFVHLWDEGRDTKYVEAIKSLLERLYVPADPELKKSIEHAVVEHLFERKAIREFFSDWRDNPQLRPAYDEGMLWINGGGTSPLTEPRETPK